jgi:hypothetical protein
MIITTTKTMRPRDAHDHYPSPLPLCHAALRLIPPMTPRWILDPGAGAGVWGEAARARWPISHITGVELRRDVPRPLVYDRYERFDFVTEAAFYSGYDLVIGNPPYKHAEAFVRAALEATRTGGYVCFLLRLAFLESQERGKGLWKAHPPQTVAVCSRRPSFSGDGKTDATAYAVFVWQRGRAESETALTWLDY